jgi:ubiquinone/menaquinone biosynthesis C-methylase UbiE
MSIELEFTGERFLPGTAGEIAYEHWHRYAFARRYVAGRRVADVACGEGYGSALLAGVAASVVGVDIAADAIAHARSHYAGLANVRFEQGSAAALPLPDATVDAVVSFETIEHLPREDQSRMIAEFARVLKADGILVLSTPNPIEYTIARQYHNPFHCYEPERAELIALISEAFPAHRCFRQRRYFGSAVWSESETQSRSFEAWVGEDGSVESARPPEAMYFIVVAARSAAALPSSDVGLSLFSDRADTELARLDGEARKAIRLNDLIGERNGFIAQLSARVQYLDEVLAHRDAQLAEVRVERDAMSAALNASQEEVSREITERGRIERQLEVLERTIAYRQSLRWWLILPWFRTKRLLRRKRTGFDTPLSPNTQSSTEPRTPGASTAPFGAIDAPRAELLIGETIHIRGWALDLEGVRTVEVRVDGIAHIARYGLERSDVPEVWPGFPDSAAAGFVFDCDFAQLEPAHHDVTVTVISRSGRETVLGGRRVLSPVVFEQWRSLYEQRGANRIAPFYIIPATSGIGLGGAAELESTYDEYLSPTCRKGVRVPILYLRTTLGAAKDWVFDPDWDIERRCGDKRIAEDSLSTLIAHSIAHKLPVLFTLNGGVWADAACSVPDWDVNDHLEEDPANCQWNEKNEVMPDDYLKQVQGPPGSPEISRSLSFNVYAAQNRHYKRRNLQSAGRLIMAFAHSHPELFIGIALDADTYMNPFFDEKQWYDYNPGTVKQFREWLAGSGPYAGTPPPGVPDLSRYRRKHPLSLEEVRKLSAKPWRTWDEVDPPRAFPREGKPFWEDPWTHEWDVFRRHLVHLHYDDLAHWLAELGVPKAKIFSSQGFIAPHPASLPFALRVESPPKNYDTGGMSVEGAIPYDGHLGAIVYGPSALNDIRVEGDANLFATFHQMDPGWAVVEFNTADFRTPNDLPSYAMGYRALREMFNYGARFASPMAWNGSNGMFAGQPGYVSFAAWRNTPLEDAMRDFAFAHAFVPLGTRLWTFGSSRHADTDDWTAADGASLAAGNGSIDVTPGDGVATLVSPAPLALARGETDLLVLGLDAAALESVGVEGRASSGTWIALAPPRGATGLTTTPAGISVPLSWPGRLAAADQIRITLRLRGSAPVRIRHIALYPPA